MHATQAFFFLTASAGIGPKVSEFAMKLDLASWSQFTSCPFKHESCVRREVSI